MKTSALLSVLALSFSLTLGACAESPELGAGDQGLATLSDDEQLVIAAVEGSWRLADLPEFQADTLRSMGYYDGMSAGVELLPTDSEALMYAPTEGCTAAQWTTAANGCAPADVKSCDGDTSPGRNDWVYTCCGAAS